ncbi:MAG TPA: tRNA uridine-5-carboxymethylaminomethyl(34) synthesis GTPase MnmE [Firmicutes bacterium]|nr:tRNA uridine-5-carboxymethylaminomethyl(34) synthesis GTPase MnmE [Bacillota bacterium]
MGWKTVKRAQEETIAAIATPPGEGAVGVIRLSGAGAIRIADAVFRSLHGRGSLLQAGERRLLHGVAVEPGTGAALDEVLVAVARAPRTYTGEDVVEFSCHGGAVVLERVLAALLSAGARLARPGEFTQRAFLNGRIDLAQAEAVIDVVRARSAEGLQAAVGGLLGALGRRVGELKNRLVALLAHLEAALDFPEDEVPPVEQGTVERELGEVEAELGRLLAGAGRGRLYREGLRAVLVGRPNVGKSSLLNALLGRDRAIVTGVPGTTRDVLEEGVVLAGVPVCLVDTAGLRAARDEVEAEGIRRTREAAGQAAVAVLVVDGSVGLAAEDREAAALVAGRAGVVAVNKADRPRVLGEDEVRVLAPGWPVVEVSAVTGQGLEELGSAIVGVAAGVAGEQSGLELEGRQDVVVMRARQEEALRRAEEAVGKARQGARRGLGEELVASEVRQALHALGEITGENVDDEVIAKVFSTFCLGK